MHLEHHLFDEFEPIANLVIPDHDRVTVVGLGVQILGGNEVPFQPLVLLGSAIEAVARRQRVVGHNENGPER